jgi:hypothetical protein
VDTYVVASFASTHHGVAKAFRQWGIGGLGQVDVVNTETTAASLGQATGTAGDASFTTADVSEGPLAPIAATHIRAFAVRGGAVAGAVDLWNTAATGRGGPPGGERPPGLAVVALDPSPYDIPVLQGFAQHATWEGLALQWDLA